MPSRSILGKMWVASWLIASSSLAQPGRECYVPGEDVEGITPPRQIENSDPFRIPRSMRSAGAPTGKIVVQAVIDCQGRVRNVRLVEGSAELLPLAKLHAEHRRYQPAMKDGQPVAVFQEMAMDFRDPDAEKPAPISFGGMTLPVRIHYVKPTYPFDAWKNEFDGNVRLSVTIDAHGRIQDIEVLKGHALLNAAAIRAVRKWKYRPATRNGEPVPVFMIVNVSFQREEGARP